jgi:hypothetical protein
MTTLFKKSATTEAHATLLLKFTSSRQRNIASVGTLNNVGALVFQALI